MKNFEVNKFITVKLEHNETVIYLAGERFRQCKHLLLNLDKHDLQKYDYINSIDDLSSGERCATLLNFVFCQADEPVIIDQPEDNIDYNYIKSTINILKEQKSFRQFIIVSHNQNLPVLADADLIMTMNNIDDKKIEIQNKGSLENKEIHNSILNLEGGREAFKLRMKKYQLIEI